ncbi:MAG: hypothetical protein NkDv07_0441 [Candidatus Improbicoccus devescovinae]|nr:MAG: hypothetical protein NkDv07_0441 [Candidatus Improbicoccus devescovinae]
MLEIFNDLKIDTQSIENNEDIPIGNNGNFLYDPKTGIGLNSFEGIINWRFGRLNLKDLVEISDYNYNNNSKRKITKKSEIYYAKYQNKWLNTFAVPFFYDENKTINIQVLASQFN